LSWCGDAGALVVGSGCGDGAEDLKLQTSYEYYGTKARVKTVISGLG
jgi:hypothetical protein